jgi:hypothetical protein
LDARDAAAHFAGGSERAAYFRGRHRFGLCVFLEMAAAGQKGQGKGN